MEKDGEGGDSKKRARDEEADDERLVRGKPEPVRWGGPFQHPCHVLPCHALSLAMPCHAMLSLPCLVSPYLALPWLVIPCLSVPRRPCPDHCRCRFTRASDRKGCPCPFPWYGRSTLMHVVCTCTCAHAVCGSRAPGDILCQKSKCQHSTSTVEEKQLSPVTGYWRCARGRGKDRQSELRLLWMVYMQLNQYWHQ